MGLSTNSNEAYVALSNGNVVKSRSLARVVAASRWDSAAIMGVKGIPGDLTPSGSEDSDPVLEEVEAPHLPADADPIRKADEAEPASETKEVLRHQLRISAKDLRRYGHTDGCQRCADLQSGLPKVFKNHSDECRLRIYLQLKGNDPVRWNAIKHLIEPDEPPRASAPAAASASAAASDSAARRSSLRNSSM